MSKAGKRLIAAAEEASRMPDEIVAWPSGATPRGEVALTGSWSVKRHYTNEAVRYVRADKSR